MDKVLNYIKDNYLLLIIFVCIILLFILIYISISAKPKNIKFRRADKKVNKHKSIKKYQNYFLLINKIPFLSDYMKRIKIKLYNRSQDTEIVLRYKTVFYTFTTLFVTVALTVILFIFNKGSFNTYIINILLSILINQYSLKIALGDPEGKIINELPGFIRDVKNSYYSHSEADKALIEAANKASYGLSMQIKKMHEKIKGGEEGLELYNSQQANRYLKLIANTAYLIMEIGDKKVKDQSLFIKNLTDISEEIRMEVFKRDQLKYWLNVLTFLALIPLLLVKPMRDFVTSNFEVTEKIFNTSKGVIIDNIMLLVSITCYYLIYQIKKPFNGIKTYKYKKHTWEKKLLKIGFIKKIVKKLSPKPYTKKWHNMIVLLKDSGTYMQIEWLILRRIITFVFIFVSLISTYSLAVHMNIENILQQRYFGVEDKNYVQLIRILTNQEDSLEKNVETLDAEIIKSAEKRKNDENKKFKELNDEDKKKVILIRLKEYITKENIQVRDAYMEIVSLRILNKYYALKKENISVMAILGILLFSYIASYFPILIISYKKNLMKFSFEEEVFMFDLIILILMFHDNVSVNQILSWMERFSICYSEQLRNALNNIEYGEKEVLLQLKESVNIEKFKSIIDRLIKAIDISVTEAFESLDTERTHYREDRKENDRRIIERKVEIGKLLGFVPLSLAISLYLLYPLVWGSSYEMNNMMNKLSILN